MDFKTAAAPEGWEGRLVPFAPPGAEPGRGWCLERHDLAAAKLAAGRIKDYEFVGALLDAGLIEKSILDERVASLPRPRVPAAFLNKARNWLKSRPS